MRRRSPVAVLIQDVLVPLAGIALAFSLVFQPGERPSLVVLAGTMMGYPLATLADRLRRKEKEKEETE